MTMTQCTTLLSDIQNFVETREISTIYYNKYQDLLQYEENADKNWLVSDIRNKNKKSIFFFHHYFHHDIYLPIFELDLYISPY